MQKFTSEHVVFVRIREAFVGAFSFISFALRSAEMLSIRELMSEHEVRSIHGCLTTDGMRLFMLLAGMGNIRYPIFLPVYTEGNV
jgi:hypothetical protein